MGYCRNSPEYRVYCVETQKMVTARSLKRKPMDQRWDADALEKMNISVQNTHEPRAARAVQVEGFEKGDNLERAPRGRSRVQRVMLYERDYVQFGITDDCRKCISNQKHGYNKTAGGGVSTMTHTERCRRRMEAALATTEDGQRRLEEAKYRLDAWTAKQVEQAVEKDVQPEGEMNGDAPDVTEATEVPPQNPLDRDAADALFGEYTSRVAAAHRTPIETEEDAFMDGFMEHGYEVPVTPRIEHATPQTEDADMDDFYERSSPQGDSDMIGHVEDGDEMILLMNKCRPEAQERIAKDAEEIMQIARDLGGSRRAYKRERKKFINNMIAEIYSAPRVAKVAKMMPEYGVMPGFSLDLATCNAKGGVWDFDKAEKRREAQELIEREKPMFLVGSPMCTAWSSLQRLSENRRDPEELQKLRIQAEVHLRFVCDLYKTQHEAGRYFLHEHPLFATSWQTDFIAEILRMDGVDTVWGDQCQYGQQGGTDEPVKKPTRWLSNSEEILKKLDTKCVGRGGWCSRPRGGQHVPCEGQVA